jgi:carboxylesterase type B
VLPDADEGRLFTLAQYIDVSGNPAAATAEDYQAFLASNFGPAAALVQTYYPLSLFNATPYPPFFAISKVITDATFKCTSYRGLNRAVEKGIPVWTYLFSHTPSCTWDSSLPQAALALAGATHSAEIQFVFGNLANVSSSAGTCSFSGDEKAISATMAASWTAMALNKSPSTKNLTWPAYTNSSSSLGVNIVSAVTPGSVDYSVCALWDVVTEMMRNISNGSA